MRTIYISQRVDINNIYRERRDVLDQRWIELMLVEGNVVIPIANHEANLYGIMEKFPPDFIVLSGGNTPREYGGDAPERDKIDKLLIQYAIDQKIPLLGVCRGMQSINMHYGGTLKKVENHVSVQHVILSSAGEVIGEVNSYHNYSCDNIPSIFEIIAKTEDGEIEAIRSKRDKIFGIMWHPERTKDTFKKEIDFLREIFMN